MNADEDVFAGWETDCDDAEKMRGMMRKRLERNADAEVDADADALADKCHSSWDQRKCEDTNEDVAVVDAAVDESDDTVHDGTACPDSSADHASDDDRSQKRMTDEDTAAGAAASDASPLPLPLMMLR